MAIFDYKIQEFVGNIGIIWFSKQISLQYKDLGYSHVADSVMLMTILEFWRQKQDIVDIFLVLVLGANIKR